MVRIRILIPANRIQEATKWLIRIKGPSEGELKWFYGCIFLTTGIQCYGAGASLKVRLPAPTPAHMNKF